VIAFRFETDKNLFRIFDMTTEKKKRNVKPREKKKTVSIYMSLTEHAILERIAEKKHMSVSGVVGVAIEKFIESSYDIKD
jgi:hypothetical protein